MPETDIGWVGLAASLILIVVAVVLSWTQGLRLERSIVWAVVARRRANCWSWGGHSR